MVDYKQYSSTPFYNQSKSISSHYYRQQQQSLETTLRFDNHQHSHHNHKAASNVFTKHGWDKWEHGEHNLKQSMTSASTANIQSFRGLFDIQHTYSTDTQYMLMATPASTEDGTKNIEHHYVNLEEQSFINCQLPHVKGRPKFGKQISPSNLARQKHSIRRNTPWHSNKGHSIKNNKETQPMPEKYNKQLNQQQWIEQISNSRRSSTFTGILQTPATNTEEVSSSIDADNKSTDNRAAASIANYELVNNNSANTSASKSSITITKTNTSSSRRHY